MERQPSPQSSDTKAQQIPTPLAFTKPVKLKHQRKETPIKELVNELKMPDRQPPPQHVQPVTTRSEKFAADPKLIGRCSEQWQNLQQTITKQLQEERSRFEQLTSLVALNDEGMLTNYKIIGQVNTYLAALVKALQAEPYPVQLYRCYRLVQEGMNKLEARLHNYKSSNREFLSAREAILGNEKDAVKTSIAVIEEPGAVSVLPNELEDGEQSSTDSLDMKMRRVSQPTTVFSRQARSRMEGDIRMLQQRLKDDNDQFVREIKKYNSILFQLQGDVRSLEHQLELKDRMLCDLEGENVRLRQEKIRDELVINNLTKKLRNGRVSGNIGNGSPSPQRALLRPIDRSSLSPKSSQRMSFRQRARTKYLG